MRGLSVRCSLWLLALAPVQHCRIYNDQVAELIELDAREAYSDEVD